MFGRLPLKLAIVVFSLSTVCPSLQLHADDETAGLIQKLQAVDARGAGHQAATRAVEKLQSMGPQTLPAILEAMNHANPLATNWLQGAFEGIADRAYQNDNLSAEMLEKFVRNRSQDGRARRLAYDWLLKVEPQAESRLVPTMLDDPSDLFRRDAVAMMMEQAKSATNEDAKRGFWKQAMSGAVDKDQVDEIASVLKKLGEPVDLVEHFGFIMDWYLIGPFDNRDKKGFAVAYPPEEEVDLDAKYDGMKGAVSWQKFSSEKKDGTFDLAGLTESHKGACDYAYTEFMASTPQDVEFRLASQNAWKLWVNGELVFAREEYHRGMRFDQYIVRGQLKEGVNTLLLKVCQNEQDESWAQSWSFQFRIVDGSGRAVTQAK